ncbi:MAG TPA: phage tail protein [Verrucomicrobiales bacterium]|nr:phage tail protein [Verrucomicrobiales bacterium]
MSEPFLGEIRIVAFGFPPKGWAECNGQLLPINQNQALFAILGTTYGGDGRVNFALPNLQNRLPLHFSQANPLGLVAGETAHTLTPAEMAPHTHGVNAFTVEAHLRQPAGAVAAYADEEAYARTGGGVVLAVPTGTAGGGQPHDNQMPSLALNFVIALQGIFPSQN